MPGWETTARLNQCRASGSWVVSCAWQWAPDVAGACQWLLTEKGFDATSGVSRHVAPITGEPTEAVTVSLYFIFKKGGYENAQSCQRQTDDY